MGYLYSVFYYFLYLFLLKNDGEAESLSLVYFFINLGDYYFVI